MPITLKSGPATIIDSGSATCFMGNPLALFITEPVDLIVEFRFETQPEIDDVAVNISHADNRMMLQCINFDQADGRGSAEPMCIGDCGDLVVFMHFRVFRYGRTEDRTVHYTLFTVNKTEVGWTPLDD